MDSNNKSTLVTVIAVISAVVAPVAALLVAYGLLSQEQAELWVALAVAVLGALSATVPAFIAKNYNDNRAYVITTAIESGQTNLIERL